MAKRPSTDDLASVDRAAGVHPVESVSSPSSELDVAANRRAAKWTPAELLARAAWEAAHLLFYCTPRQLWIVRRVMLRLFGARIGRRVHIHPTVRIAIPWNLDIGENASVGDHAVLYSLGPITIGNGATVSQQAHLCAGTHDYRKPDMPLVKASLTIGRGAWICADAFVGPGASVGDYAIAAARAVVVADVQPWTIVGGNPAHKIRDRTRFDDL